MIYFYNPKPVSPVDAELAKAIMARRFYPSVIGSESWEGFVFSDIEIRIKESTDLYGAVLWPSVRPTIDIILVFSCCVSCAF